MIYFVCPDPQLFISGGNLFNLQILEGLKVLGEAVISFPFQTFSKLKTNSRDIILLDSIYMNEIQTFSIDHLPGIKMMLIHLLPSMLDNKRNQHTEKVVLEKFDLILANSRYSLEYLMDMQLPEGKIKMIQPWTIVPELNKHIKRQKLIVVANWFPAKQIDLLLQKLSEHALPDGLTIHFYGETQIDNNYWKHCISILEGNPGLTKHILLEGVAKPDELQKIYAETLCLVDVSLFESYGMAVTEAIVSGIPVLTLGNGQVRHWIGQGSCMGCKNIDDLIDKLVLIYLDELDIPRYPITEIITEGSVFRQQLVEVFKSPV
jgi:glycosyltransferase involved in cell wall biosynthesis